VALSPSKSQIFAAAVPHGHQTQRSRPLISCRQDIAGLHSFERFLHQLLRRFGASFPDFVALADFFGISEGRLALPSFGA